MTTERQNQKEQYTDGVLTREEIIRVIQWCVELKGNQEIVDLAKEEFKKDITRQNIWRLRNAKKHRQLIKRLRRSFEDNILKIPLANKVDRLKILSRVVREGLKLSLKTITARGDEIYELKLGAVTQAVKEARVEMEGEKPLIDNSKHYYFTLEEKRKYAGRIGKILLGAE